MNLFNNVLKIVQVTSADVLCLLWYKAMLVCLFYEMIFPSRELIKLQQGDINAKLATANLSHTKHWFNVYHYELHKSRNCDLVPRRQYFSHYEISG